MKKIAFAAAAISLGLSLLGCNSTTSNPPEAKSEDNLFREINEKIDVTQKSLGALATSVENTKTLKKGVTTKGYDENGEALGYAYNETDIPSFVNKQQQMLYIVSIVNYVREHLMDGSYGVNFEYGKLYEGAAFMETLFGLNNPIRQYKGPSPVLKLKYTTGDHYLLFESNWDYQSEFMRTNNEFWNIRILSKLKVVYDDEQKIQQIWVNYAFEGGLAFGAGNSLFDYKNKEFYSFYCGNDNGNQKSFSDPSKILAGYNKVNSGNATSDNLVFCGNTSVEKAALDLESTSNNYIGYNKWISNAQHENLDDYFDWSEKPGNKEKFDALYDEVYNKLKGFTLPTSYQDTDGVKADELINDSANYAFWRSKFICDNTKKLTYIPFIERTDLIDKLSELKKANNGALANDVDKILASREASAAKYVGNYFLSGEDKYEIALSGEDTTQIWADNLITYTCNNGFSYELLKNGTSIISFDYED